MIRGLLVLLFVVALPAAASAQERTVLAELPNESEVSTFAGLTVVSSYDLASRTYDLVLVGPGGVTERLPVAPSPAPFDADLGPDSAGRAAVVYSRCADPRRPAVGGCDLFIHTIGVDGERPIRTANTPSASEYEPSLWRGEVAWVRSYGEDRQAAYTRPLLARRTQRSVRQPGVTRSDCPVQLGLGDCTRRRRELTQVELNERYLALIGRYEQARVSEVWLVDRRSERSRRVALMNTGEGGQTFLGLSFSRGRLGWHRSCFGDPGGCEGRGGFRYRPGADTYEVERTYRPFAGFSLDGDGAVALDGYRELGDEPGTQFGSPCDDEATRAIESSAR